MRSASRQSSAAGRQRDFWLLFIVCYPFFLIAAIIQRASPSRRSLPAAARRSIFPEASSIAYRTLPYAF